MPKYEPREIRVFISSTFVDMHREREVLVKDVFPDLRRKCRERDVELTEVDLRWGVDEEKKLDEAVDVCLREIDMCHPFFIALMGERYGRPHPPEKFQHLNTQNPNFCWLETCEECSVTELEIMHAAFVPLEEARVSRQELAKHVRFYFRDFQDERIGMVRLHG